MPVERTSASCWKRGSLQNPPVVPGPTWPGVVTPPSTVTPCVSGSISNPFPCFSGVRVFSRDYANPRIYTANVAFEQEVASNRSWQRDRKCLFWRVADRFFRGTKWVAT